MSLGGNNGDDEDEGVATEQEEIIAPHSLNGGEDRRILIDLALVRNEMSNLLQRMTMLEDSTRSALRTTNIQVADTNRLLKKLVEKLG